MTNVNQISKPNLLRGQSFQNVFFFRFQSCKITIYPLRSMKPFRYSFLHPFVCTTTYDSTITHCLLKQFYSLVCSTFTDIATDFSNFTTVKLFSMVPDSSIKIPTPQIKALRNKITWSNTSRNTYRRAHNVQLPSNHIKCFGQYCWGDKYLKTL